MIQEESIHRGGTTCNRLTTHKRLSMRLVSGSSASREDASCVDRITRTVRSFRQWPQERSRKNEWVGHFKSGSQHLRLQSFPFRTTSTANCVWGSRFLCKGQQSHLPFCKTKGKGWSNWDPERNVFASKVSEHQIYDPTLVTSLSILVLGPGVASWG
jgi:hypothetical protein